MNRLFYLSTLLVSSSVVPMISQSIRPVWTTFQELVKLLLHGKESTGVFPGPVAPHKHSLDNSNLEQV